MGVQLRAGRPASHRAVRRRCAVRLPCRPSLRLKSTRSQYSDSAPGAATHCASDLHSALMRSGVDVRPPRARPRQQSRPPSAAGCGTSMSSRSNSSARRPRADHRAQGRRQIAFVMTSRPPSRPSQPAPSAARPPAPRPRRRRHRPRRTRPARAARPATVGLQVDPRDEPVAEQERQHVVAVDALGAPGCRSRSGSGSRTAARCAAGTR